MMRFNVAQRCGIATRLRDCLVRDLPNQFMIVIFGQCDGVASPALFAPSHSFSFPTNWCETGVKVLRRIDF